MRLEDESATKTFGEWLDSYGREIRSGGSVTLYEFAQAAWDARDKIAQEESAQARSRVEELEAENARLVKELNGGFMPIKIGWNHTGACHGGCTCDAAKAAKEAGQ